MRSLRVVALLPALAAAVALAGCGGDESAGEGTGQVLGTTEIRGEIVVELEEANDSNTEGARALLSDAGDGRTRVVLEGLGEGEPAGGGANPGHVHVGSCDDLAQAETDGGETGDDGADSSTGERSWPLEPLLGSERSETVIAVALGDLLAGEYAVDLHIAEDAGPEGGVTIACGDVPDPTGTDG